MKRTRSTTLTALLLLLSMAGCRGPLPCTGCEEQGDDGDKSEEQGEDESPPDDLPCGGADLMTDTGHRVHPESPLLLRVLIMKRSQAPTLTALLLLLSMAGCRGPLPCTGCEEQGDDGQEEDEADARPGRSICKAGDQLSPLASQLA